jgi:hypothetical protein
MYGHTVQSGYAVLSAPRPLTKQPVRKAAMATQKCTKCGLVKPLSEYSTNGGGKHKRRCKPCRSGEQCARYAAKTPDRKRADMERISSWVKRNPEKYLRYAKVTRARNPEQYRLRVQLRRRRHQTATPAWASKTAIRAIYAEASARSKSGVPYEVDHIVPLISHLVCGLHCEANLQVIPMLENKRKNNRSWPDMP